LDKKRKDEAVSAPRKPIKLIEIEEAPLGGGGSLTGDGVGFISTIPAGGDSSPEGAGDDVDLVGEGGVVFSPWGWWVVVFFLEQIRWVDTVGGSLMFSMCLNDVSIFYWRL
jgi:hypothetical protein